MWYVPFLEWVFVLFLNIYDGFCISLWIGVWSSKRREIKNNKWGDFFLNRLEILSYNKLLPGVVLETDSLS